MDYGFIVARDARGTIDWYPTGNATPAGLVVLHAQGRKGAVELHGYELDSLTGQAIQNAINQAVQAWGEWEGS